jgi:hypothetical protein
MQTYQFNATPLIVASLFALQCTSRATAAAGEGKLPAQSAVSAPDTSPKAIPWDRLGTKAGADYQGDRLSVTATAKGVRLQCVFQRLDGEATHQGLWLASTVTNQANDCFRVRAVEVGRVQSADLQPVLGRRDSKVGQTPVLLRGEGEISVAGQTVRFIRPGLVEEFSVSMDGVRQDFVVMEKPPRLRRSYGGHAGQGELRLGLEVSGAQVEVMPGGARLVLEGSGRKIAYGRLRATDATGRELLARIEVSDRSEIRNPKSEMVMAVVVNDADAVYPIRIDPTFSDANWISMNPSIPGANYNVFATAVDGSGNLYIGGGFAVAGGVVANRIAKWNGSSWSALGSGMGGLPGRYTYVNALAVSGSDLYAAGQFTTAGGSAATNIAKWDGSSWSALGSGILGAINVSALAASGSDLYAAASFPAVGGSAGYSILKWNGSSWRALGGGWNGSVSALAVSGGDLYAGGVLRTADGSAVNYIAKWDGSSWSELGSGVNDRVLALAVSGSDLYAGGYFTTAGGNAANYVAKWDGSSWSALGLGMNSFVYALAVSGNDVYAGGDFIAAGGIAGNHIAKWDGSSWSALGSGIDGTVGTLAVSGNDLYAGGGFIAAGGIAVDHIAKWDGNRWSGLGSGMNYYVDALAVSGSNLYAGGEFTAAGDRVANYIAKSDGSNWTELGSGMNSIVCALAVSGSDLYAGGYFTTAGGNAANYIAKWNGSNWSPLGSGMEGSFPYYGEVLALAVSGSDLYAGGYFTTAGGSPANYVAKWNGSNWSPLGSGMNGAVRALAVSGSDLYAGGYFTTAGGSPANYIAKWDGSNWSGLGSGMDYYVSALVVSGSELYAGGAFAGYIAKWNGSSWSVLGSGVSDVVFALAVSGSDLYAGGRFGVGTAGGGAAIYIAKWDGSGWSALGSGMGGFGPLPYVNALAVAGSDLYAGGGFTTAGGKISPYVAKAITIAGDWLCLHEGVPGPYTNTLDYVGVPNAQYLIQFATNLTTSPWFTLATNTVAADGRGTVLDCSATNRQRFYRVGTP